MCVNSSYLNTSMTFLLSNIRGRDREQRINSFVTIGLISIAVEDHAKPYMARVLDVIRSSLPSKVLLFIFLISFFKLD